MIFVVNGFPGCGKTTFENRVVDIVGTQYCYVTSIVDRVKEIAKQCGWDGTKTDINRKFLSDLKDLLTEWNDVPYKSIKEYIRRKEEYIQSYGIPKTKCIFFIDCREPKEIDRLCKDFGAKSILVLRAPNETLSNHADAEVLNYHYDIVINNTGSLKDLQKEVKSFIEKNITSK